MKDINMKIEIPERLLTFEEFIDESGKFNIKRFPAYNNFFLQFLEMPDDCKEYDVYRTRQSFKRFQKENPALEETLTKGITKGD